MAANLTSAQIANFYAQGADAAALFDMGDGSYVQAWYSRYDQQSAESGGDGLPHGVGPVIGWMRSTPGADIGYLYDPTGVFVRMVDLRADPLMAGLVQIAALVLAMYTAGQSLQASGAVSGSAGSIAAADEVYGGAVVEGWGSGSTSTLTTSGASGLVDFTQSIGSEVIEGTEIIDAGVLTPTIEAPAASAFLQPIPAVEIASNAASSGLTWGSALTTVRDVAGVVFSVASMNRAYQQAGQRSQSVITPTRTVDPRTGEILTRNADGSISRSRPAVGVATATADGGVVINNGDGTYDYIDAAGNRSTRRYGSTSASTPGGSGSLSSIFSGIDSTTWLMIGGVVAGIAVLAQSRR